MDRLIELHGNPGARKKKKVLGRGNSSGHGSSSTKGGKGQTARSGSGYKPGFEGGQTPLYRRLPKLKGFNNPNHVKFQVVNVDKLNAFEENEEVNVIKLYEKKLIGDKEKPVKILGDGELSKKINVRVDRISKSAKLKIEKAKGTATELMTMAEKGPAVKEPAKK